LLASWKISIEITGQVAEAEKELLMALSQACLETVGILPHVLYKTKKLKTKSMMVNDHHAFGYIGDLLKYLLESSK
jgi:hypothetical protein